MRNKHDTLKMTERAANVFSGEYSIQLDMEAEEHESPLHMFETTI